jgi:hypothetical protein
MAIRHRGWQVLLLLTMSWCMACGSDVTAPITVDIVDAVPDAGPDIPFVPPDLGQPDLPEWEVADLSFDTGDVAKPFGDWNKPCASNGDCESGYCIQISPEESVCTIPCVEECPKDWLCKGIQTGPDLTFLCVPPLGNSCKECAGDADCVFKGDLCVPVGETGSYCLNDCAKGQPCPDGYSCLETVVAGLDAPALLCTPDTASCVCNADLDGTSKECSITNDFGKCYGETICDGPAGWTDCDALTPEPEQCDGLDNNCDGAADEGIEDTQCSVENEFGTCTGTETCLGADGSFCDAATPVAEECDGLDNNCDGVIDETFVDTDGDLQADCIDTDDDSDGVVDIADNCPDVKNIGQADLDEDGLGDACDDDDDGDGIIDEEDNCPDLANPLQEDMDVDGLGDLCDNDIDGDGSDNVWDCAPENPLVYPGAEEICDGLDNNCNLFVDEGFPDNDGDNVADCGDADDDNDTVPDPDDNCPTIANPDQSDIDGDGLGDVCDPDADADGVANDDDCQPLNPLVYPGADELCNGYDDNCNGLVDEGYPDFDDDLAADCVDDDDDNDGDEDASDCEPLDPAIFNGAVEACNGYDDNCDGIKDEACPPVHVSLHQVQAVARGKSGQVKAAIVLGRPVGRTLSSEASGYKLHLGASR